jgi:hypothetical protein
MRDHVVHLSRLRTEVEEIVAQRGSHVAGAVRRVAAASEPAEVFAVALDKFGSSSSGLSASALSRRPAHY